MKIYQIHDYGGEWEDKWDIIAGSYLSKEKAKLKKDELEAIQAEFAKCKNCPLYICDDNCDDDCEKCNRNKSEKAKAYCDRYEPDRDFKCNNYGYDFYESYFKVVEVDVIE